MSFFLEKREEKRVHVCPTSRLSRCREREREIDDNREETKVTPISAKRKIRD
jgi:hypothetical protein